MRIGGQYLLGSGLIGLAIGWLCLLAGVAIPPMLLIESVFAVGLYFVVRGLKS